MEPTNYCRQILKELALDENADFEVDGPRKLFDATVYGLRASQKFLLPDGGRLYDDKEVRALDDNEPLSLPYPIIALEYHKKKDDIEFAKSINLHHSSKSVVLAFDLDGAESIVMIPVVFIDHRQKWFALPQIWIPRTGYLRRDLLSDDGRVTFMIGFSEEGIPKSDYADEVGALMCFLNVLRCNNVHTDVIKARKVVSSAKKRPLPFDDYHILTIDVPGRKYDDNHLGGTHRSPREHLRRGHIRRLADGKRVWVNATVVCAGSKHGVIKKDYAVRAAC